MVLTDLPNHFTDPEVMRVLFGDEESSTSPPKYALTLGLLMRLSTAVRRIVKRSLCSAPAGDDYSQRFLRLIEHYCTTEEVQSCLASWDLAQLVHSANTLSKKSSALSMPLLEKFDAHPLLPPSPTGRISFNPTFLAEVAEYHKSLSRPDDVFSTKASSELELVMLERLAALAREECSCGGRKQVYCGSCGGLRMPSAEGVLPPRVDLPFDVLLLVHWQESLHKYYAYILIISFMYI